MNDLIRLSSSTPLTAMSEGGASLKHLLDGIAEQARYEASALDVTTDKGRKAIASLAYKVSRTKTALDDAGKELVFDIKKKAAAIDADRKTARDTLDALRDEVRKPLTDFEEREKRRTASHQAAIIGLSPDFDILQSLDPAKIESEKTRIRLALGGRDWEEFSDRAASLVGYSLSALDDALRRAIKWSEEQAELAKLKADAEARAAKEAEERRKKEIEDAERRAAEQARIAAEHEAQERAEREQKERATELARVEAERVAAEARAEAAEIAARTAAEKERERIEQEAKKAEAERMAREQDIEHRRTVNRAAAADFVKIGFHSDDATAIIKAIVAGAISNVSINY